MELITTNTSGQVRTDELEGRPHLVVPMVMITEGVHSGSDGPLFYPGAELGKTPAVWNHKPVVVYHPEKNGIGVSACDPNVLNTRKVGVILNTQYTSNKLKAEAWVEEDRLKAVDQRVLDAITSNSMMELSTGLFTDNDPDTGQWQGQQYDAIARNLRPDHLAILPDQVGACSTADGAGFLRLNQAMGVAGFSGAQRILKSLNKTLESMGLVGNMSDSNIRQMLSRLLKDEFQKNGKDGPWIEDVYTKDGFAIIEYDGKLYKHPFTIVDKMPKLGEGMVEVIRVTEYRTAETGAFVGNQDGSGEPPKDPVMTKKEIVDGLIANKRFAEDDREELMAMDEKFLSAIVGNADDMKMKKKNKGKVAGAVQDGEEDGEDDDGEAAGKKKKKPTANKEGPADNDPVANLAKSLGLPAAAVQGALQGLVGNATATHAGLVAGLVANKACNLSEPVLQGMDVPTLNQLTQDFKATTAQPIANYSGAAGFATGQVNNAADEDDDEPLVAPTMNFGTDDS